MKLIRSGISLLVILSFLLLSSCNQTGDNVSMKAYLDFYNSTAEKLGFEGNARVLEEDGVCGFSAFDGVFTVCFTVDEDQLINYMTISTSSEVGQELTGDEQMEEALLWASYLAMPFYKNSIDFTDTDISTVAGMLLASFDEDVPFLGMNCRSSKNKDGFEISFLKI